MRLLLDTHVWIWSLLDPARLGRKALRILSDPASELWLSPISLWEFLVLADKGRILVHGPVETWVDRAFEKAPINEAAMTHEIVRASRRIVLPHRDPADRFIAATAHVLDLVLVTADERLRQVKDIKVLPAR
ncbi:MAG: type II toxin-antitoxin system VapC family toxin [Planctomycetes bacterium]|nr:type II toxin-antitoxin system VapC family toxin [Planctomycetota bacterium]